jgi:hypothetical protein
MTPVRRAEPRRRRDRRALAAMPRAGQEPATTRQLDAAIVALRAIVSVVASADALARLSDKVRALSLRVERLKGRDDYGRLPILDQPTPATHGAKVLQPFAWPTRPHGCDEQKAIACNPPGDRRRVRSVAAFEARPLLLVSGAAAILVAVFISAMIMLEAVQPRVHVPAAKGAHKIAGRQAPSFLISPVPIYSQSFNPAVRDDGREVAASLDALDQRHDLRVSGH